jgi:hypothetical protein
MKTAYRISLTMILPFLFSFAIGIALLNGIGS